MPKPGEDEQGHQKNASGSAVIIMIAEIVIMLILVAIIIIVVVAVVVVVIVVVVVAVVVTVTIILILRRRIVRHNIHLRSARTCMCLRIRSPLHACPACLSVCVCHGIYVLCLPVCPISVQSLLALPLSPSRSLALSLSLSLFLLLLLLRSSIHRCLFIWDSVSHCLPNSPATYCIYLLHPSIHPAAC